MVHPSVPRLDADDAAVMTHVLDLPDDALLAVLAYLPPKQLIACRVACKRLRDLCLHRSLWRHVPLDGEDDGMVRAVLTLAPCIKSLMCSGPTDIQASLIKNTTCVVTKLSFFISDQGRMALAMAIILKLYALGGLRELCLTVNVRGSLTPLLQAVYYLRGLKTLLLDTQGAGTKMLPVAWCDLEAEPSLIDLIYVSRTANPFLGLLLRTHASTLQNVRLLTGNDVPVSSLLNVPGLRSLECSPDADLSRLVELSNLHTIVLFDSVDFHPGALQFLREASHLRSVRLWDCSVTALQTLAHSRSASLLEKLVLMCSERATLKLLPFVLPAFPALRVLDVGDSSSHHTFLRDMCAASLPNLTTLAIKIRHGCLHGWLHCSDVQDLLLMNPRLHLSVGKARVRTCTFCFWCLGDCHELLRLLPACPESFSSHSKTTGCPKDCYNITA